MSEARPKEQDTKPDSAFTAAKELNRSRFRRYLRAKEAEAALQKGKPPPSTFGRIFRHATNERRLVLFTLGIIVAAIVVSVFIIEMWGDDSADSTVTTALITLAGTGLGFIGGMVSRREQDGTEDDDDQTGGGAADRIS